MTAVRRRVHKLPPNSDQQKNNSSTYKESNEEESSNYVEKRKDSSFKKKIRKPRPFYKKLKKLVSPKTMQATVILLVAMATAVVWNRLDSENVAAGTNSSAWVSFLQAICQEAAACHASLLYLDESSMNTSSHNSTIQEEEEDLAASPGRRIVVAAGTKSPIFSHTTVATIPRRLQIWDVDALQAWPGPLVPGLSSPAYLAWYLATLIQRMEQQQNDNRTLDPLVRNYLKTVLPKDYPEFHPLAWSGAQMRILGGTHAGTTIRAWKQAMQREFALLEKHLKKQQSSTTTSSVMTFAEYQTARLHVLTRSFGTGPLTIDQLGMDPLVFESREFSSVVNVAKGCHAMVPVLDSLNHHPHPNVAFRYDTTKRAFVVTSLEEIAGGQEIYDSYGKRTEADLFAKFGFTNGDGSSYTEASLAVFHAVHVETTTTNDDDMTMEPAVASRMVRYLQYDDGYEECVYKPDDSSKSAEASSSAAWQLKELKFQHLMRLAPVINRWVIRLHPRNRQAKPPRSFPDFMSDTHVPSFQDSPKQQPTFDGNAVFSTCRLLTLTDKDYDGQALQMLQEHLDEAATYQLPPAPKTALEARTLLCVARLAASVVKRLGGVKECESNVRRAKKGSVEWTVAQVKLAEAQSAAAVQHVALQIVQGQFQPEELSETAYRLRPTPCPDAAWEPLLMPRGGF